MRSWLGRSSLFVFMWAFTILLCPAVSAGADLESAKRAYEQKDYANALKQFAPLAAQGNTDAQLLLGEMYMKGQGVLKDSDQAMKWFTTSAAQGNADAQFFLGAMYLLPQRDIAEGLKWLRLSAKQGHQDAQLLLGKTYLQGAKQIPPDPVQAEMWLQLAAKNNLEFYQAELVAAERQMTLDQVAKGKALAEAWKPQHGLRPEDTTKPDEKPKS
jgi:uncharacterized protein